jgi:hypothetical protein
LELTDAVTAVVKASLTGKNGYTSTLTITNPDKRSAAFKFSVE